MALPAGTRLGPYEIVSFIGAGAMGVVYKARDTRLGRHVAIKVLPPAFARDPDRLARFEREARSVAAINHPNIVSVHDIGSADVRDDEKGTTHAAFLVTELLDGETLRTRLDAGPLTARKSADVAMQVARGLAAAHDRGIVHRDLKPENIVLQRDGLVKILDFGLAKQSAAAAPAEHEQETIAGTDAGTVLGTVGYMAPEQVRGEPAGPRSDLFALGAVLYELASGRRPFAGPTAAETMTAILREDPPALSATPPELAPGLDRIVRHAIEKEPDDRFQSARDFAFALQTFNDAGGSGSVAAARAVTTPRMRPRERAAWLAAAVLALAAAAAAIAWPRTAAAPAGAPVVFSPALPWRDANLDSPAVSPDGRRIAFIARDRGDAIVVRSVDALQVQPLRGTNGARTGGLFWSPDGRSLGFFSGGKLKTITLATGQIDELADAPSAYGGTWGRDGTILFSPDERAPIFRVSAGGGQAASVTTLDASRNDAAHRWPQFLPDGRHFVFMPWNAGSVTRTTQLASLDGGPTTALFESESAAIVAGGYFIYARDIPSRLMAQAFDPKTFLPDGRPATIVHEDNVSYWWWSGEPQMSASATMLVYTTAKYRLSRLTWYGRTGQRLGTVGDPDVYYDPTLSPDGQSLAVEKRDPDRQATDLWTVDLTRGTFSRLTSAPGFESVPTWSADRRRIAYGSDAAASPSILMKNASGTGVEETLVKGRAFPTDWSEDGRYLLFMSDGGVTRQDVWVYDTERRTAKAVLATPFNETAARFSPDGKWIAYVSDETRSAQVYVQSFPGGTTRIQVSAEGGLQPQWRRDGKELFYLTPDTTLMAVDAGTRGADLMIGAPRPLFVTGTEPPDVLRNVYSPATDGQRFLVMSPIVPRGTSPLVGVLNWAAGLTRK
jgi:Tol biopolymer transport system component/tRNA A-37 threonylcarbamoyl transferase component Bud32